MSEPFKTVCLDNGLTISFYDLSNRYYGDFHRACIQLIVEVPLSRITVPGDLLDHEASFPEILHWEKKLERMGVKSADLDRVCQSLGDDFVRTVVPYLSRPDFPEQLLRRKVTEKLKGFNRSSGWD